MLSIYGMYSIFNLEKTNVCACVIYIYTKADKNTCSFSCEDFCLLRL